jgi:hypothetical protein
LSNDPQPAVEPAPAERVRPTGPGRSGVVSAPDPVPDVSPRPVARSRVAVGLTLAVAGLVWAIVRGLPFYGLNPVHLAYDLDQPPWMLLLVSAWLCYRSRRR